MAGLASTSASASFLSSFSTAMFGAAATLASFLPLARTCDKSMVEKDPNLVTLIRSLPLVLTCNKSIAWKITTAISAALGAIGTYKAANIFRREPFPLMPQSAQESVITTEFGSREMYNFELKSAWKWIGSSIAVTELISNFFAVIDNQKTIETKDKKDNKTNELNTTNKEIIKDNLNKETKTDNIMEEHKADKETNCVDKTKEHEDDKDSSEYVFLP